MKAVVGALICLWSVSISAAPITLDDMLAAQMIAQDGTRFSPDGKWLAFYKSLPVTGYPSWGAGYFRGEVSIFDRTARRIERLGSSDETRYRMPVVGSPWSPDSQSLLLIEWSAKHGGFAVWNAQDRKLVSLPGRWERPSSPHGWANDVVIYTSIADQARQEFSPEGFLSETAGNWRDVWADRAAHVTVRSANPVFKSSAVPPGSLMLADRRTGRASVIASGDYFTISVAPGAQRFAALKLGDLDRSALNERFGRRSQLELFELDQGTARLIRTFESLDVAQNSIAWSPDGRQLLVGAKQTDPASSPIGLYLLDASGKVETLKVPPSLSLRDPDDAFVVGWPLLQLGWIAGKPVGVAAQRGQAAAAENMGLVLDYGQTSGLRFDLLQFSRQAPVNLTGFAAASVKKIAFSADGAFALGVADGALWRIVPGRKPVRIVIEGDPKITEFAVDRTSLRLPEASSALRKVAGRWKVAIVVGSSQGSQRRALDISTGRLDQPIPITEFAASTDDFSAATRVVRQGWGTRLLVEDSGSQLVEQTNAQLTDRDLAPVRPFTYTWQGRQLKGWMVIPPVEGQRPQPAIVSVYGGVMYGERPPHETGTDASYLFLNGHFLAAQGYVVVYPSLPLEAGASSDLMETLASEVVAAVDHLAAQGIVDAGRIGLLGHSFGGYSVAAILSKRSDRFKAGVSSHGLYDLISGNGGGALRELLSKDGDITSRTFAQIEGGQTRMQAPFWRDTASYIRNSPIFHVDTLDAPLLMIHGDLDNPMCDLPQAFRMYQALVRAGKKPALVHHWGELHTPASAGAIRDEWERIQRWFAAYL